MSGDDIWNGPLSPASRWKDLDMGRLLDIFLVNLRSLFGIQVPKGNTADLHVYSYLLDRSSTKILQCFLFQTIFSGRKNLKRAHLISLR